MKNTDLSVTVLKSDQKSQILRRKALCRCIVTSLFPFSFLYMLKSDIGNLKTGH